MGHLAFKIPLVVGDLRRDRRGTEPGRRTNERGDYQSEREKGRATYEHSENDKGGEKVGPWRGVCSYGCVGLHSLRGLRTIRAGKAEAIYPAKHGIPQWHQPPNREGQRFLPKNPRVSTRTGFMRKAI